MSDPTSHPPVEELTLPKVLMALADPSRLAIVRALGDEAAGISCTAVAQAADLQLSRSTLSHHQRTLREAGIIHSRAEGTRRLITLRRDDLDACFPGLLDAVLDTAEGRVRPWADAENATSRAPRA